MDEQKRQSMIAYLRRKMAKVGIRLGDVAAAIADERKRHQVPRYSNAFGETWDGTSKMPQWLKQAKSAGQSLEHFAVTKTSRTAGRERPAIDWSRDPFAGTRLATTRQS